jgi:hypothetical protein
MPLKLQALLQKAFPIPGSLAQMPFELQAFLQRCLSNYRPSSEDAFRVTGLSNYSTYSLA